MKTAISVPDDLFRAAEAAARRSGVSRSRFFAMALEEYLRRHRADDVTAALDAVYANRKSGLDPALTQMQLASVAQTDW